LLRFFSESAPPSKMAPVDAKQEKTREQIASELDALRQATLSENLPNPAATAAAGKEAPH
jgi:hypothetical protein